MPQPLEYGLAPNDLLRGRFFRAFLAVVVVAAEWVAFGFVMRAADLAAGADGPNASLNICLGVAVGGITLFAGLGMLTRTRVAAALATAWLALLLAPTTSDTADLFRSGGSVLDIVASSLLVCTQAIALCLVLWCFGRPNGTAAAA